MGRLQSRPLGALGAFGQNTESSQIDLPPQFVTTAVNCFVNENGRLTARKSMEAVTTDNGSLGNTDIVWRCYRHNKADGTSVIISSTEGYISHGTTTLTQILTNASTGLYQFATLNGKLFAACVGEDFKSFAESNWAASTISSPSQPRAIHAAFGRLWALSSDGWTLHWSDLLDGTNFTTGASGSLDLSKMHTQLRSPALAVHSFGRQIVVLCRDMLLVLGLSNDLNPNDTLTPIYLSDAIPGIGTIARDSVVSTGDDIFFLADDGLRSLKRSLTEKQGPAPLTDVSALNTTALMRSVAGNTAAQISASWNPAESWYQLYMPTTKEVWTFDIQQLVPQVNTPRSVIWTMGDRPVYHAVYSSDDKMYFGGLGGLYRNTAYDSNDRYTFRLETGWLAVDAPQQLKHLKKLVLNVRGGAGQTGFLKWSVDFDDNTYRTRTFSFGAAAAGGEYGTAEYNVDEYGSGAGTPVQDVAIPIGGDCTVVKFSIEFPVSAYEVTLNNAQLLINMGRLQ